MTTVALITLGDPGRLTGGYLYHRRMAEMAPRFGVRLAFISFPQRPFPLAAPAAPFVLRRARAMDADALVLDSIAAPFLGAWPFGEIGIPMLGMLHQPPGGVEGGRVRRALQAPLDRRAYREARLLMVASEVLAERLVAEGVPRSRLRVVPPGRDVAHEIGPSPGDLRRGRRVALIAVANWIEHKGILDLLEALARLPDDTATLHLAGSQDADPSYTERVLRRLAEPDLAGRVVVHGPLPVAEVAALYEAADVFVLPAGRETYGTVFGEAMSFGLPVIGYRAGNIPYLAENEREGLIVEPGDVAGLARSIERLARDDALRLRLGEAAAARAATRPTWEESGRIFFDTIRGAISGAGSHRTDREQPATG